MKTKTTNQQQALATGRRGLSRVDTMTLAEIIAAAKKARACSEALAWARSCNSDEQFWAELKPEWACWLLCNVRGLSPEAKAWAEAKACEEPRWAYWLRCNVRGLSPEVNAQAEAKACEEQRWAYCVRCYVLGLSPEAKARAEAASAGWTP